MWRKGDDAAKAGAKGGKTTAQRGSDYYRHIAAMRTTHAGGRPSSYRVNQQTAQTLVSGAIASGKLPRLSEVDILCTDCQNRPATGYDHRDYKKPFDIDPVCDKCQAKRGPARDFSGRYWGRAWTKTDWNKRCDEEEQTRALRKLLGPEDDKLKALITKTKRRWK